MDQFILEQSGADLLTGSEPMSKAERELVLYKFNDTAGEYARDKTLHQEFEEQALRHPENLAIVYEDRQLTYGELNRRANQLATHLRGMGVERGTIVGIMLERSPEMMVGIMGILKAGGAYLPVDPAYPAERIEYILQDSGTAFLLLGEGVNPPAVYSGRVVSLTDAAIFTGTGENLACVNQPEDLAYVLYTSGTTGNPKGVIIAHTGVVNLINNFQQEIFSRHPGFLNIGMTAPYVFDASIKSIFGALLLGHAICLVSKEMLRDLDKLFAFLGENSVEIMVVTPTLFNLLVAHVDAETAKLLRFKHFIIAGEELKKASVINFYAKFPPEVQLTNLYGPTECTVNVTIYHINYQEIEQLKNIPIGRVMTNCAIYILNEALEPVPIGATGEIYIGGVGVGLGYLNKPELSRERFLANPYRSGERMYKTGDLARWLADGNVEFLGRIDHQVKIRGFRIELGEIESVLAKYPGMGEALVLARPDEGGTDYLAAYFIAASGEESVSFSDQGQKRFAVSSLREYLANKLPDYMIPSYFVQLERFPLTHNGKIARDQLPDPKAHIQTGVSYVAPRTSEEESVQEIWQTVLGIEGIGIEEDFFHLGGQSIKATQVLARIRDNFQVEVSFQDFFRQPTIAGLVALLSAEQIGASAGQKVLAEAMPTLLPQPEAKYYDLSYAQQRLWLHSHLDQEGVLYNIFAAYRLEGAWDLTLFKQAYSAMIQRHDSLRTVFTMVDGAIRQQVLGEINAPLEYLDYSNQADAQTEDLETVLRNKYHKDRRKPFDLKTGPLFRASFIRTDEEQYYFALIIHHLISDGWSTVYFMKELLAIYQRLLSNETPLPQPVLQYKDYVFWQQQFLTEERLEQYRQYWLKQFAGEVPVLDLPLAKPRPEVRSFDGEHMRFPIDPEIIKGLRQIAVETRATLFMVFLAAVYVLLHKYSRQAALVIGIDTAGRSQHQLEQISGLFVNTLALKAQIDPERSFLQFMAQVREMVLGAYDHQDYPFELLTADLNWKRDLSRSALFDVMVSMNNLDHNYQTPAGLSVKDYLLSSKKVHFDLLFTFEEGLALETGEEFYGVLSYSTDIFTPAQIELMQKRVQTLLANICLNPGALIAEIDMLTAEELEISAVAEVEFDF